MLFSINVLLLLKLYKLFVLSINVLLVYNKSIVKCFSGFIFNKLSSFINIQPSVLKVFNSILLNLSINLI